MYSLVSRKHIFALCVTAMATAGLLLAGCGSSKSAMEVSDVKSVDQVAVPIVTVDQYIDMTDLQDGGSIASDGSGAGGLVQRLLQGDSFDLGPMAELLRERTYGTYAERLPPRIMPEEEVIQTDRYKNFSLLDEESNDDRMQRLNRLKVPEGYKQYNVGRGSVFGDRQRQMFGAVPDDADAILLVSADYEMIEDNPFYYNFLPISPDRAYVEATVRMEMIDRNGNEVMEIVQTARSNNHVNTVGGITMEASKIQPLCTEATEKAVKAIDTATKKELAGA
jgi:hypothetical protein